MYAESGRYVFWFHVFTPAEYLAAFPCAARLSQISKYLTIIVHPVISEICDVNVNSFRTTQVLNVNQA